MDGEIAVNSQTLQTHNLNKVLEIQQNKAVKEMTIKAMMS